MNKTFATSDLHIGHNREFVWEDRGFSSIEEHDRALVENWNSLISPEDTVYILGDVMLKDTEYGIPILKSLNGNLHIIRGNHDTEEKIKLYLQCDNVLSVDAALYVKYPEVGGYTFYLSHYPTLISANHSSVKSMKHAVINLFGHTHQTERFFEGNPYMYCCGLDAHNMRPVDFDEIIEEVRLLRSTIRND